MPRTYLHRRPRPLLGRGHAAALIATTAVASIGIPLAAANLFDSQPLDQERFAVLAQAVGRDRWKLLVLEQIKPRPLCWETRRDGLVKPSLNSFDFTGICSRYLDSNGYSLRTGGSDMASSFRLRLDTDRQGLKLSAMDPNRDVPIVVARANRPKRDRNAFVKLELEPGWSLERRAYQGRTLSHVYFAHAASTDTLLARAGERRMAPNFKALDLQAPHPPSGTQLASNRSALSGDGPIRLQVIPFSPKR